MDDWGDTLVILGFVMSHEKEWLLADVNTILLGSVMGVYDQQ